MDNNLTPIIVAALLGLLSTYLMYVIKRQKEKIDNIQHQLSDKKYKVYYELYSIFFDIIKINKGYVMDDPDNLAIRLFDVKKDLAIYSTDKILRTFIEWLLLIDEQTDPSKQMYKFLDLFVLIRKDMGYRDTDLTTEDFLLLVMQSKKELEKFKETFKKT